MEILEYTTDDGASPFARWFDRLNAPAALKVRRALAQLEAGNFANTKSLGGGVRERIVDFGPGYRVYFGRIGVEWVILLGGGTKKRQQNDIDSAKVLWTHYKSQRRQQLKGSNRFDARIRFDPFFTLLDRAASRSRPEIPKPDREE